MRGPRFLVDQESEGCERGVSQWRVFGSPDSRVKGGKHLEGKQDMSRKERSIQ